MNPEISGRPHSVRHSQPLPLTPEGEQAMTLDGVVLSDRSGQVAQPDRRVADFPSRDGRDFRPRAYTNEL